MQPKKSRWSKVYESSEEELVEFLDSRNITAQRLKLDEFEVTDTQTTPQTLTLWCAEGSMTVRVDSAKFSLQPGDSVQLAAAGSFQLLAGISGCVYYESAR